MCAEEIKTIWLDTARDVDNVYKASNAYDIDNATVSITESIRAGEN